MSPTRTTSAEGFTLPGLGGSPLPQNARRSPQRRPSDSVTPDRYDVARETDSDYPVIRGETPAAQATIGDDDGQPIVRSARREQPRALRADEITPEVVGDVTATDQSGSEADAPLGPLETARSTTISDKAAEEVEASPSFKPTAQPMQSSPRSAAEAFGVPAENQSFSASDFVRSPRSNSLPELPSATRSKEAFGEALQVANGGDPSVLVSNQTPVISSDIRGPKQILVGREAIYRVRLQNQGAAPAQGVVASIRIPATVEVIDTTATQGTVLPSQNSATPTQLEWQLARLDGRASETLDIKLVPRDSRPLELGVSWTMAPIGSRTVVEVQEPQLKIDVNGPSEVLFDKPQVFKLTLSNPGTGPAENVRIDLVPPGGSQDAATSHSMGNLLPGESRTVEIELTAREAGKLMVKAIASAEGGLQSDVCKEIFCRKPELEVDYRGPATKYVGTVATYFFRVRNPGTAAAENVTVRVTLPEGAEFSSASEGQTYDDARNEVVWHVNALNPGDDNYMELKCVVQKPGVNQIKVVAAAAESSLMDEALGDTNVIALADLKLQVSDPSGPVAVDSQAVYEIRVENRGANTAKDVNIVALFSEGIEPDQAEGAMYTAADGRVTFRTIEELPAGRDVTLRIRAHALTAGTHVFRAEVLCRDLEIKLAAEETTRFYADDVMPDAEMPGEQASTRSSFEATVR
jgi:uncharacterized repeat protein (TIGR01451 family)